MGQDPFKKLSKFQKFQLSKFTLTWSNEGKRMVYRLISLIQKNYRKN